MYHTCHICIYNVTENAQTQYSMLSNDNWSQISLHNRKHIQFDSTCHYLQRIIHGVMCVRKKYNHVYSFI